MPDILYAGILKYLYIKMHIHIQIHMNLLIYTVSNLAIFLQSTYKIIPHHRLESETQV